MSQVRSFSREVARPRGKGASFRRSVALGVASAMLSASAASWAQPKRPLPPVSAVPPAAAAAPAAKPPVAKPGAKPTTPAAPIPAGDATKKEAGAHFRKGRELFDAKKYAEAKAAFQAAEALIPAGLAEYYLGRCAEELSDPAEATNWYQRAVASGKLKAEQAADANGRLTALRARPAPVKVTSDPVGATIMVDGSPLTETTPTELRLAPGTHKLILQHPGMRPSEQTVDVAPITGASVDAKLENDTPVAPLAVATPPATTTSDRTTGRDMRWVYATGAAAVVALGVGTAFGIKALGDRSKFNDEPTRELRDKGTRDALIADVGFGIGLTLAVTSIVLYVSAPTTETTAASKRPEHTFATFAIGPVLGAPTGGTRVPALAGAAASFTF